MGIQLHVDAIVYGAHLVRPIADKVAQIALCGVADAYHFLILTIHPAVNRLIPLPIASAIGSVMLCRAEHDRA